MGNLSVILGFLTAAPVLLYVERKLTFLMAFAAVTASLWFGAPQLGYPQTELRFIWIFLGVIAGAFFAVSGRR